MKRVWTNDAPKDGQYKFSRRFTTANNTKKGLGAKNQQHIEDALDVFAVIKKKEQDEVYYDNLAKRIEKSSAIISTVLKKNKTNIWLKTWDIRYDDVQHKCKADFCFPQNEQSLVRQKKLDVTHEIIHPDVYVCQYGSVHVCNDATSKCPVEKSESFNGTLRCAITHRYLGQDMSDIPYGHSAVFNFCPSPTTLSGKSKDLSRRRYRRHRQNTSANLQKTPNSINKIKNVFSNCGEVQRRRSQNFETTLCEDIQSIDGIEDNTETEQDDINIDTGSDNNYTRYDGCDSASELEHDKISLGDNGFTETDVLLDNEHENENDNFDDFGVENGEININHSSNKTKKKYTHTTKFTKRNVYHKTADKVPPKASQDGVINQRSPKSVVLFSPSVNLNIINSDYIDINMPPPKKRRRCSKPTRKKKAKGLRGLSSKNFRTMYHNQREFVEDIFSNPRNRRTVVKSTPSNASLTRSQSTSNHYDLNAKKLNDSNNDNNNNDEDSRRDLNLKQQWSRINKLPNKSLNMTSLAEQNFCYHLNSSKTTSQFMFSEQPEILHSRKRMQQKKQTIANKTIRNSKSKPRRGRLSQLRALNKKNSINDGNSSQPTIICDTSYNLCGRTNPLKVYTYAVGDIINRKAQCTSLLYQLFYSDTRSEVFRIQVKRTELNAGKLLKKFYNSQMAKQRLYNNSKNATSFSITQRQTVRHLQTNDDDLISSSSLHSISGSDDSGDNDLHVYRRNHSGLAPQSICDCFHGFIQFYTYIHDDYPRTAKLIPNKAFIDFFCNVSWVQWNLLCRSPYGQANHQKLDFDRHALALLNIMRCGGRTMHDREVIPRCSYVSKYVPPIKDLEFYGFECKHITYGSKDINLAYASIDKSGQNLPYFALQQYQWYEHYDNDENAVVFPNVHGF